MKKLIFTVLFMGLISFVANRSTLATSSLHSFFSSSLSAQIPSDGLVAWYPFNGNANDESGNGNHGTVNGATLTVDRNGNALSSYYFNGSGNYIDVPFNASLGSLQQQFTSSVWIQMNGGGCNPRVYEMHENLNCGGFSLAFNGSGSGARTFHTAGFGNCANGVSLTSGNTPVTTNTWHHVSVVVDGINGWGKLYVDGVLVHEVQGAQISAVNYYGASLCIGNIASYRCDWWGGNIDDLGFWNRSLTPSEIQQLYQDQTGQLQQNTTCLPSYVPTDGLVGYWPFCGNANDESGNGNNGTVNGATLAADRNGNASSAYSFNGISDFITVPHAPELDMRNQSLTIGFWKKTNIYSNQPAELVWYGDMEGGRDPYYVATQSDQIYLGRYAGNGLNPSDYRGIASQQSMGWEYITGTFDINNNRYRLYKNGVMLVDSVFNLSSIINYSTNGYNLMFGGLGPNTGGWGQFFNGTLDEIAIYNRLLTSQEIQELYQGAVAENPNPLICSVTAPSTTLCEGESVTLSVNTTGGAGASAQLPANLQQGLVAYYPFNGNANDESGNGNNGTVNGATLTSDRFGNAGSAYSFDGVNDFINLSQLLDGVQGSSTVSYNCWARKTANSNGILVSQWVSNATPSGPIGLFFGLRSDDRFGVSMIGGEDIVSDALAVNTNEWNLYSIVFDGSQTLEYNRLKIYQNGNEISLQPYNVPIVVGNQSNLASIGARGFQTSLGGVNGFFNGGIDDIAIYNRALSPAEIQQLYNAQSYAWSTNATTPTITVTPTTNTNYSCTVTQGNQTCTASVDITVNPNITNTISATIIEGETYTLGTQTLTTPGTYTEVFTSTAGCDSTVTLTLAVEPLVTCNITAPTTTLCEGESVTLSVNTTGGTGASSQLPANLQQGLVAYYPFNGNANDESGNGNNGVVNGAKLTEDRFGNVGSAYSFDGVSNFIEITPSILQFINNKTQLTISYWFNASSIEEGAIWGHWSNNYGGVGVNCGSSSGYHGGVIGVGNYSGCCSYNSGEITPYSTWHLATIVFDAGQFDNEKFRIYIDGLYNTEIFGISNANSGTGTSLNIGRRNIDYDNFGDYFGGLLDDLGVWSRTLSPSEIQQLYTAQSYAWSTNATTPTITVTPTQNTTYSCTVTQGNQTCTASVDITVNPNVTNAISATIIEGETYTLGAQTLTAAGTYTEVFTSAAGCDSTVTLTLAVEPLLTCNITAPTTTLCEGESVTLSVNTTGGAGASSQLPANLQQGLVAYYPFNGNANDESGNGNDGVVNGATLTSDRFGNAGSAYSFDGVNDFIESQLNQNFVQGLSFHLWLKTNQVNSVPQINLSNSIGSGYGLWSQINNGSSYLNGVCGQAFVQPNMFVVGSNPIVEDFWYCVDLVCDITNGETKFYINGVNVDMQSSSLLIGSFSNLVIGRWPGNEVFLNGFIDDLAIYNRALSPSEIQQLYTAQSYAWSTNATTPTITVSPTQTTTYSCTVTQGNQTCTASVDITVNPNVTNTISATIIEGETYILGTQTLTTAGTYTEVFTSAAGCDSTVTLTLAVEPLLTCNITAPITTLCEGESVTLSVNTTGGAGASSQLPANLQQGLVAYYPFNGNANDESGNGNDGTVNGATLTEDRFGNVGSAYSFDGVNDFINCGIWNLGPSAFTISAWVNETEVNTNPSFVVSKFDGISLPFPDNNILRSWILYRHSGNEANRFAFEMSQDGVLTDNLYFNEIGQVNVWKNIAVTFNQGEVRCFVNGVIDTTFSIPFSTLFQSDVPVFIGISAKDYFPEPMSDAWFSGEIDDLIFHNRALSPSEIQQLYTAQSYAWSNNATTPTINVAPTTNTNYSCTVTQGNQTCTASVDITVNPNVTNTISATIIEGETYTLGAQTLTTAGTYTEVFTSAAGCDSTVMLTLAVEPLLTCNITTPTTTLCEGESVTLSVNTTGGAGASSQLPANLQQGLVAYYPFNGNANDESGNGLNLLNFGALLVSDRFSNDSGAYEFNGSNYLQGVTEFPISGNSSRSVSFWCAQYSNDNNPVVAWGPDIIGNRFNVGFNYGGQGLWAGAAYSGILYSYNQSDISNWHHYVFTFDSFSASSISEVEMYQDGELLSTSPFFLNPSTLLNTSSGYPLEIGQLLVTSEGLQGKVDDIAIYNRALSPSEIQQLYTAQSYAWSTNATTPTITVTPTQNTTYSCTVTQGNQTCTASVDITVNPLLTWYADTDGDSFGDGGNALEACDQPQGFVPNANDCNDAEALAYTGAVDLCDNGIDEDCSGADSICIVLGCTDITACNFNPAANTDDASCTYPVQTYLTCDGSCINDSDGDGVCDEIEIAGCTDPTAFNYNPQATNDDGSCEAVLTCDVTAPVTEICEGEALELSFNVVGAITSDIIGNFNLNTFDNHTYVLYSGAYSWYDARNLATQSGGYLAVPNTFQETEFIYQLVAPNYPDFVATWIGVTDEIQEGFWRDVNGNQVGYFNWASGEPNNQYDEDYGMLYTQNASAGLWNDGPYFPIFPFVIEYDLLLTDLSWSTGATTPTITVSPTQTTTYSCTVTQGNQTCTASVDITVNPNVTNAISATIIEGETYTLGAQSLTTAGTYTEVFTSAAGCDSTVTLTLAVEPLLTCNITTPTTTLCAGQSATLAMNTTGGAGASTQLPANLQQGLVAYYPFNGNANDESGNGNNGVVNGATLTTDRFGNTGSAYSFDGVNDYIQVADNNLLDIQGEITLSAWIKSSNYGSYRIIDKTTVNASDAYLLDLGGANTTGRVRFIVANAVSNQPQSDPNSVVGEEFNLITVTYDLTQVKFYVNGELVNSVSKSGYSTTNNNPLRFGANSLLNNNWFNGKIDDVAIYNRALSPSEIQQLYTAQSYAWSNNATTPTITVTPTQNTTYSCTVTQGNQACTANVDITVNPLLTWYADNDGDGFGDSGITLEACDQPQGFVSNANDCNDAEALAYSGAVDLCDNGIDEDCSGMDSTCIVLGCTDITACNFNPAANTDDASCTYPLQTYLTCDGTCINDTDGDGVCDEIEIAGCTEITACNYEPSATDDNASCTYPAEIYLTCDGFCINDSDGDGVCDEIEIAGCTDPTAFNYNPQATNDDGSCEAVLTCDVTAPVTEICEGEGAELTVTSNAPPEQANLNGCLFDSPIQVPGFIGEYNNKLYTVRNNGNYIVIISIDPNNNFVLNRLDSLQFTYNNWERPQLIGGVVYFAGGWYSNFINQENSCQVSNGLIAYDIANGIWSNKANMPTARGAHCTATDGQFLYVFGGLNCTSFKNQAERYNPATNTWTSLPNMPRARERAGAVYLNNKIYVLGGNTTYGYSFLSAFDVLDLTTLTWSSVASLPLAQDCENAPVAYSGEIYLRGGRFQNCCGSQKVWKYNPTSNTWIEFCNGQNFGVSLHVYNDALLFINSQTRFLNSNGIIPWSSNGGSISWSTNATTPTITVTPTQTTTYTATVTTATQTCTDSITITVNPLLTWYADADADGFGNPSEVVQDCNQPVGYTSDNTDCNDDDATTYPGAAEICDNNRDENCDGVDSLCFVPVLGCTDINACNFNPDANTEDGSCVLPQPEICNAIDDNCNGQVDEGFSVESLNVVPVTTAIFPVCVGNAVKSANLNTGANSGVIAGEGNDLWFSFTAQYNAVRVGLSAATGDNEIQLFQLNNGCLQWLQTEHETYTSSTLATGNQTLITDELIAGNTYYVAIHHISGPINISAKVCFNHFVASTCDHYYSNNTGIYPSVCSSFKAQYQANAIAYRFEVLSATQNNINQNITPWSYTTTSSSSVISRLGNILPANMGASTIQYTMQVPVLYSIPDAAGNLTNIEASATQTCQVVLSSQPTIALRLTDRCPTLKSLTSTIAPDRTVCGAMRYDWEFTEVLPVEGLPQIVAGGTNATVFFLSNVPGITVGKTYSVRVRPVHSSNTAGQWGTAYCLRVGAAGMMNHPGSADAEPPLLPNHRDAYAAAGEMNSIYAIYPNPTTTGSFVLQYNGPRRGELIFAQESMTELIMMDITGKVVFKTQVVLDGNAVQIEFGNLASGVYVVMVGEERMRLVVQ